MTPFTRTTRWFAACALALVGGTAARAGLLPVSVTITPDGGNYRWTYAIVLPTDTQLRAGDFFTIYDFAGLTTTSNVQPDGWKFSQANVGPTPTGVTPTDDPTLPNLTWTYTGPTINSGQIGLGNFWADSAYGTSTDSSFTAKTQRTADGKVDANITSTVVPVPSPNLVPEPGTLALAGIGLPLLGLFRRRRLV